MSYFKKLIVIFFMLMIMSLNIGTSYSKSKIRYLKAANDLHAMGLFTEPYKPNLGLEVNRQTGVALLVKMLENESMDLKLTEGQANKILTSSFSDESQIDAWARKYVALAANYDMVFGYPDKTFKPKDVMTLNEMATIILRNLGYTVDTNLDFNKSVSLLESINGITHPQSLRLNGKKLIVDDLVGVFYESLKAEQSSGKKLIVSLVESGKVHPDNVPPNLQYLIADLQQQMRPSITTTYYINNTPIVGKDTNIYVEKSEKSVITITANTYMNGVYGDGYGAIWFKLSGSAINGIDYKKIDFDHFWQLVGYPVSAPYDDCPKDSFNIIPIKTSDSAPKEIILEIDGCVATIHLI